MSDDQNKTQTSSKPDNLELRIVLIGDIGVGKKSMVQRFKLINCSETKTFPFDGFFKKKTETTPNQEQNPKKETKETKNEDAEDQMAKKREEKRISCMRFSKFYKLGLNTIDISFYPCAEEQPFPEDYEPKEEDEFYEYEKEYKMSIRMLIKELEFIFLKPAEDQKTQIEVLFLLCFDLSNMHSFEKLVVFSSQITKHFSSSDLTYKMLLIGNKVDKKNMTNDDLKIVDKFKSKLNLPYLEISTSMFFNFNKFFEQIILDNYSSLEIFQKYSKNFHDIIFTKSNFSKRERPPFVASDTPGANKYNNNPYSYPDNEKEFIKIFKDKNKYNKYIFINKRGIEFPPIKTNEKEFRSTNNTAKSVNKNKPKVQNSNNVFSYEQTEKNEKIKKALELQSGKPGFSLGVKAYKPLGLAEERERLRNLREQERMEALGNVIEVGKKVNSQKNKGTLSQDRYQNNRMELRKKKLEELKNLHEDINERHNEIKEKNSQIYNDKINAVLEKEKKYTKIYEEREKEKEKLQGENYFKNNNHTSISIKKSTEPRRPFYDPLSSISNKKGFSFGMKYPTKIIKVDTPEYPTFQDDFEKLIEKNKNRVITEPTKSKISDTKKEEKNMELRTLLEKQKTFEERRKDRKKNFLSEFFEDRRYKLNEVYRKKIDLKEQAEKKLHDAIQQTYKNDENYLIRDINYTQTEISSPKFSMQGRYEHGSIFQVDKVEKDDDEDYNTTFTGRKMQIRTFEKPNFSLIRPKYPAFSFGYSQRFSTSVSPSKKNENDFNEKDFNDVDYKDTQSFLNAQTTMGTAPRLKKFKDSSPGPIYKIKGFAEKIVEDGKEVSKTRLKLIEKKKKEEEDKKRRALLREERYNDRKNILKLNLSESANYNTTSKEGENKNEEGNDNGDDDEVKN